MEIQQKKRGQNLYLVPVSQVCVKEGLNERFDYGDIEELELSIKTLGIQEPLKGYTDRTTGKIVVVKGHRRFQAVQNLIAKGFDIEEIPMFTYTKTPTDEEILIAHITSNSGKPLTSIEKSNVAKKLQELGNTCTDIAKKLGMTYQQIDNFLKLAKAPDEIKEMISSNIISSTTVTNLFKSTKSFIEVLALINVKLEMLTGKKLTSNDFKEELQPKNQGNSSEKFDTQGNAGTNEENIHQEEIEILDNPDFEEYPKQDEANFEGMKSKSTDEDLDFDNKGREIKSPIVSKKISFEDRAEMLRQELTLIQTDNDHTNNLASKIELALSMLKENYEISLIINSVIYED